jgi:hypothetical protein
MNKRRHAMLYPAYIRRNKDGTDKATFPDFDDSFSNIKKRSYQSKTFKATVENYLKSRHFSTFVPTRPEDWFADRRFQGGYWTLIDLNLDRSPAYTVSANYRSSLR